MSQYRRPIIDTLVVSRMFVRDLQGGMPLRWAWFWARRTWRDLLAFRAEHDPRYVR